MTPEREALARRWTEGEVIDLYPSDVGALLGEALAEIDRLRAELECACNCRWNTATGNRVVECAAHQDERRTAKAERERIIEAGNAMIEDCEPMAGDSDGSGYADGFEMGKADCVRKLRTAWDALKGGAR